MWMYEMKSTKREPKARHMYSYTYQFSFTSEVIGQEIFFKVMM